MSVSQPHLQLGPAEKANTINPKGPSRVQTLRANSINRTDGNCTVFRAEKFSIVSGDDAASAATVSQVS